MTITHESLNIFLPILSSFVICFITIYFSNKANHKSLNQQEEFYAKTLRESNKKYLEQRKRDEENQRLKHLPYLTLIPKKRIDRFSGKMSLEDDIISIPFKLVNEGVNTAFSVRLQYLEDKNKPLTDMFAPVSYGDNYNAGYDVLGVRSPIDTDVLSVNKTSEFCLYLSALNKAGVEILPSDDIRWTIIILFEDIQERKYSQKYTFYTSTRNNQILRVNSYMPQLIK